MAQVDAAVAVKVDAVFDVRRRQELGLADLAGKGAYDVASGRSPRCTILSAAISSPWNSSLRRQSCASVASVRITGSLPMSPVPLSLSMVQIAMMSFGRHAELPLDAGEQRGVRAHQLLGAVDARRNDAGRGVVLEAHGEGAVLAMVEGDHGGVGGDAGKGGLDGGLMPAARASPPWRRGSCGNRRRMGRRERGWTKA